MYKIRDILNEDNVNSKENRNKGKDKDMPISNRSQNKKICTNQMIWKKIIIIK